MRRKRSLVLLAAAMSASVLILVLASPRASAAEMSTEAYENNKKGFAAIVKRIESRAPRNLLMREDAQMIVDERSSVQDANALADGDAGSPGGDGRAFADGNPAIINFYLGGPKTIREVGAFTYNGDTRANQVFEVRFANNAAVAGHDAQVRRQGRPHHRRHGARQGRRRIAHTVPRRSGRPARARQGRLGPVPHLGYAGHPRGTWPARTAKGGRLDLRRTGGPGRGERRGAPRRRVVGLPEGRREARRSSPSSSRRPPGRRRSWPTARRCSNGRRTRTAWRTQRPAWRSGRGTCSGRLGPKSKGLHATPHGDRRSTWPPRSTTGAVGRSAGRSASSSRTGRSTT